MIAHVVNLKHRIQLLESLHVLLQSEIGMIDVLMRATPGVLVYTNVEIARWHDEAVALQMAVAEMVGDTKAGLDRARRGL